MALTDLKMFLTGGPGASSPAASLGGEIASNEVGSQIATYVGGGIAGVVLTRAFSHELTELGNGTLTLSGTATSLVYTPPSGLSGAPVDVSTDGDYIVLGGDGSAGLLVTAISAVDGTDSVTITNVDGNLFDDLTTGELNVGETSYRALICENQGAAFTNLGAYIEQQPTPSLGTLRIGTEATVGGGGSGGPQEYWRIEVTAHQGGSAGRNWLRISEVQFRETIGVAAQTINGTATASSFLSGTFPPSNGFDNDFSSGFGDWVSSNVAPTVLAPQWIQFQFDAGFFRDVKEVALYGSTDTFGPDQGLNSPVDFLIRYSDDGTNWTTTDSISGLTWATSGPQEVMTFTVTQSSGGNPTIQEIADELTAPSGIVLNLHPFGADLALGAVAENEMFGLWLSWTIDPVTSGVPNSNASIRFRNLP